MKTSLFFNELCDGNLPLRYRNKKNPELFLDISIDLTDYNRNKKVILRNVSKNSVQDFLIAETSFEMPGQILNVFYGNDNAYFEYENEKYYIYDFEYENLKLLLEKINCRFEFVNCSVFSKLYNEKMSLEKTYPLVSQFALSLVSAGLENLSFFFTNSKTNKVNEFRCIDSSSLFLNKNYPNKCGYLTFLSEDKTYSETLHIDEITNNVIYRDIFIEINNECDNCLKEYFIKNNLLQ